MRACSIYGSGEAIHADLVAARARELLLCDSAASVRASIAARFAGNRKIKVIAPEDVERLPDASLDLIFANSLAQYLTAAELDRMLALWRRLLAPGGTLIVADVIPPHVGAVSDGLALLRYAAANGFLGRRAHRPHAHRAVGLSAAAQRSSASRATAKRNSSKSCARPDLPASGLPKNVEHNPARMTFRARARVILTG